MTDKIPLPTYGVWILGQGWVRGKDGKAFADYNRDVARQLARRLGKSADVYFVDAALVDLEQELLEAEKNNIFQRIFGLLKVKRG